MNRKQQMRPSNRNEFCVSFVPPPPLYPCCILIIYQRGSDRPARRRRINTEEKAKVVAAFWGTEIIKFLDALGRFEE